MEKFLSLKRIEGEPPHIVTGIKNNKVPPRAIRGGFGTYVVGGTPSLLNLNYQTENGNVRTIEISKTVKEVNNWKRLTDKRTYELAEKLEKMEEFDLMNLPEILKM